MEDKGFKIFKEKVSVAPLGIIAPKYENSDKSIGNARLLAEKIDSFLVKWAKGTPSEKDTFIIDVECPRFQSGDGKAIINRTVRGMDLYIVVDVGDYSRTYKYFGKENHMSPDDHFMDLKRIIEAMSGKAHSVNIIMPLLYGGRQHRRTRRESLDCAVALQELQHIGVNNILTIDAHDDRVANAIPLMTFDNIIPSYQMLKKWLNCKIDEIESDKLIPLDKTKKINPYDINLENLMIISPDLGASHRNDFYASKLGCQMGMFSKRRDYKVMVNGKNPIISHDYIGEDVKGKDIFISDDMIASGGSILDVCSVLKEKGVNRIFAYATFALFTEGLDKFDKAFEDGILTAILATNLTYRTPELSQKEWFLEIDVSKYLAYYIASINHDESVSEVIPPDQRIDNLLELLKKGS
ncbi:MAG: ribose-phosphate diphosphokinase [Oscillospiraceae bacterium]|jgi:ribose-phosphate pyrophosphokinase|nr:ribose-phosphate diphosphokinase [Oscillospiraceae bacterium]